MLLSVSVCFRAEGDRRQSAESIQDRKTETKGTGAQTQQHGGRTPGLEHGERQSGTSEFCLCVHV